MVQLPESIPAVHPPVDQRLLLDIYSYNTSTLFSIFHSSFPTYTILLEQMRAVVTRRVPYFTLKIPEFPTNISYLLTSRNMNVNDRNVLRVKKSYLVMKREASSQKVYTTNDGGENWSPDRIYHCTRCNAPYQSELSYVYVLGYSA